MCTCGDKKLIMTISTLKNGDLLFMRDSSDFSKVIIETTTTYSHVGIYFDGMIYHASWKQGVGNRTPMWKNFICKSFILATAIHKKIIHK